MKKLAVIAFLILSLGLFLAGCGSSTSNNTSAPNKNTTQQADHGDMDHSNMDHSTMKNN